MFYLSRYYSEEQCFSFWWYKFYGASRIRLSSFKLVILNRAQLLQIVYRTFVCTNHKSSDPHHRVIHVRRRHHLSHVLHHSQTAKHVTQSVLDLEGV